jgi:hypothetical protein
LLLLLYTLEALLLGPADQNAGGGADNLAALEDLLPGLEKTRFKKKKPAQWVFLGIFFIYLPRRESF